MENLLNLKELSFSTQEILTVAELDDCQIQEARQKGWTLRATFEAERRIARYGSESPGKSLFGVFALPVDRVLIDAAKRADEAVEAKQKAESRIYEAEKKAKECTEAMFNAQRELADMKAKVSSNG